MSRKLILLTSAALVLILGLAPWGKSQPQAASSGVVAVEGATLIDGTGAAPVSNSVILIENGKIAGIGPRSKVRIPAGAQVIDAKGKYIIPGLIDSHVHFRTWMGEMFLNNGITTVFDFGNNPDWIIGVRDAERSGKAKGIPRFYVVGDAVNRPGGNDSPSFFANAGTPAEQGPVKGAEWAHEAAKAMIARGIDALKTTSDNLSAEEVKGMAEEAHKANLKFIGHVDDVYKYVGNGLDGVVHMWGLSSTLMTPENQKKWKVDGTIMNPYAYMEQDKIDPLIKFMLDHHAALMPMLMAEHSGATPEARDFQAEASRMYMDPELRYVPFDKMTTDLAVFGKDRSYSREVGGYPFLDLLPPAKLAEAKLGFKNALEFTRRFARAGGLVWLGTDSPGAGTVPGMSIRQEIEVLVDGGFTPMQAIQAATKNTADWFNIADQVGTLQTGRFGDMVVLDANPLNDIRNIDKIHAVIKGGEVLDGKFHRTYHPSIWVPEDDAPFRGVSTAPAPVLTSVTSEKGMANGHDATILVAKCRNITNGTLVYLNGKPLETVFMNINELRATVLSGQMPATGPYNVTLRTPWPGGGTSEARPVTTQSSAIQ